MAKNIYIMIKERLMIMFRDAAFYDFKENIFKLIGKESMLICAGTKENGFNMMTASWGFMGEMWGQESAAVVVRPQRYTMKFLEDNEYFTLNFMGDNKEVYKICGTQSGRDIDKCKETGLTPMGDDRYTYFSESRLVLLCKKKYIGKSKFTFSRFKTGTEIYSI